MAMAVFGVGNGPEMAKGQELGMVPRLKEVGVVDGGLNNSRFDPCNF